MHPNIFANGIDVLDKKKRKKDVSFLLHKALVFLPCTYSRDHIFIGLSVCVAASVPWLDLVVSLLGAVKMSVLALMAPAVLDMASHWNDT